jgi:signal transduction histidine kinase
MNANFKVLEPNPTSATYAGPYQEIAVHVRELLNCDYALVALPEENSIRICALAGRSAESCADVIEDIMSRLRDWGPLVIDDARLIATPVVCGDHVVGVLIGYSAVPGAFTTDDLEKLMRYAPAATRILASAAAEQKSQSKTPFSTDELVHFFRLVTVGEFSACFAHEVRNPLTLIRGHLRLLQDAVDPAHPLRCHCDAIDRAARRIEEMAERMLDFSKKRIRSNEFCDLGELISESLRFVQPYIRTKSIEVRLRIDPELPAVEADRWQLLQALVNFFQNAADAMAQARERLLSVDTAGEGNWVRIVIADTGTGIAPANLSKIFEPFFTTKGERGTGLGLYIAKQVVEEHGGTILVESSALGTAFTINIPIRSTARPAPAAAAIG